MPESQRDAKNSPTKIKYRWIRSWLTVLMILMLAIVAVIPGVLRLIYRADAQVALGHAKTVRMAMKTTAIEQYGVDSAFSDASCQGGVAEGLYEEILWLSKAPGDFWILQMDKDGYQVQQFIYQEGEYTVWYTADPGQYTVYHENTMIDTGDGL